LKSIRLGIAGLGTAGGGYASALLAGRVPRISLAAVCDRDAARLARFEGPARFTSVDELIASGTIDSLLVATPHFAHATVGVAALEAGLHVLVEKPIAVHKAEARRLIEAHERRPELVFSAMFNQRTDDGYRRIRELIHGGALGEIRRVNWTVTNWFRPDAYYRMGGWRATWAGEGGGVLLNQAAHHLDLFQWLFGMPSRVRAICGFGRYHDIEVEDDVTACFEFSNGATAVFVTSTGEAPGTNHLEIAAENGRIVCEDDEIRFTRNDVPAGEFSRTATEPFATPGTSEIAVGFDGHGGQHFEILGNFAAAILDGTPLIAPAVDGIRSVELANAILLSAWTGRVIDLPLDEPAYVRELETRIAGSRYQPNGPAPK
jgi:predicted dehydrogenase